MVALDRLTMLRIDADADEVLRVVTASPFSRIPLYRDTRENVVGMLRVKDLVERYVSEGRLQLDRLVRPVVRVSPDLAADKVVTELRERRAHSAIVSDSTGRAIGLITIQDVLGELLGRVQHEPTLAAGASRARCVMTTVLFVSLLLILANALFVAAEFALIGSPRPALEGQASRGDRFARRILRTLTSPQTSGRVHRHVAARYHARQPRAGHVRRAHAGGAVRARLGGLSLRSAPRRCPARSRSRSSRRPYRAGRNGPEGHRAAASGDSGAIHRLADARDARLPLPSRAAVERHRAWCASPAGHSPQWQRPRAGLHTRRNCSSLSRKANAAARSVRTRAESCTSSSSSAI